MLKNGGQMTKHEIVTFKKGDRLFSPTQGYVTIEDVRGYGSSKEFCIEIGGKKVWYKSSQLKG
jgi:hypothetical protein